MLGNPRESWAALETAQELNPGSREIRQLQAAWAGWVRARGVEWGGQAWGGVGLVSVGWSGAVTHPKEA